MSSPKPIHLNRKDIYDIGGKIVTLTELQDAVIKASMYDNLIEYVKGGRGL